MFVVEKYNYISSSIHALSLKTTLVVVTKNQDVDKINSLINLNHIDFGEISVDFKIDEEMATWFSVYSWMRGLAFPEKFEQYKNFTVFDEITGIDNKPNVNVNPTNPLYGQGTLFINSSQNNPLFKINYINVHPVSLSELLFDTRETDVMYVTCTASFKYDYFTVEKILPPNE